MMHNTNQARAIKRIAIIGGGLTAWTAAAALAKAFGHSGIELVVVESPQKYAHENCVATTPTCVAFHQWLGLAEQPLLKSTGASYLLATRFKGWSSPQQDYFMPFGDHGFMLNRMEFPQYIAQRYLQGYDCQYDDYSLAAQAAKLGRFCHPSAQASSLFSTLSYGLSLNSHSYTQYLRDFALHSGVKQLRATIAQANINAEGYIESVSLVDEQNAAVNSAIFSPTNSTELNKDSLAADFFIDCTGAQAELIGKALNVPWQSPPQPSLFTHRLSIRKSDPHADMLLPLRELRKAQAGFVQTLVTQTQTEQQYCYHADFISHEDALRELGADGIDTAEPIACPQGRRANFWHKNCVALGEAAGNFSTLAVGDLYLLHSALLRLINLFPKQLNAHENAAEFNRLTHLEYDQISDFTALHYYLAARPAQALPNTNLPTSDYWQTLAAMPLSDRLLHRLNLFTRRAAMPALEGETFSSGVWISLLLGNNYWPERVNPLMGGISDAWISQELDKMKRLMRSAAESMPTQAAYLNQYNLRVSD